jgi:hypothetical protein
MVASAGTVGCLTVPGADGGETVAQLSLPMMNRNTSSKMIALAMPAIFALLIVHFSSKKY